MVKGVIYDMDDLMVNSFPLHTQSWEILLKSYGKSIQNMSKSIRSGFPGMRIVDIAKEVIKYFKLDVELNGFCRKREEIFLKLVKGRLQTMPGLIESLDFFQKNKFKIALASSGTKKYINLVLLKFKIRNYFDAIVSGDEVEMGKPHPDIFLVACKKLKLRPEECVVLEDAEKGIESAKEAGCKCIAVINRNTLPKNPWKADAILNSLDEVAKVDFSHF